MNAYTCSQGIQAEARWNQPDGYYGLFVARATIPAEAVTTETADYIIYETDGPNGEPHVVLEEGVSFSEEHPVDYDVLYEEFAVYLLPTVGATWTITDDSGDTVFTIFK